MGTPFEALLDNRTFETNVELISSTLSLTLDPSYRHNFAALEFYSDANGETVVTPTAGSITYEVVTPVTPNTFEPFTDNVKDATSSTLVSWAVNTTSIRATITGITGATHARLRASCNIT